MPYLLIGKSKLGDLGFCQKPEKMSGNFFSQFQIIEDIIREKYPYTKIIMTSMTNSAEIDATNNEYFPKIRIYDPSIESIFSPKEINSYCSIGKDKFRPATDFILWNSTTFPLVVTTFSREAPILSFESSTGKKALGVILRPSLMKYGDYLFASIRQYLRGQIQVTLVTCNHFEYPTGNIPSVIQSLAKKYGMKCIIDKDSQEDPECYKRNEDGNHVVAMW